MKNDFVYCPVCGAANDTTYKFCKNCGNPLGAVRPGTRQTGMLPVNGTQPVKTSRNRKKRKTSIAVGIILLCAGLLWGVYDAYEAAGGTSSGQQSVETAIIEVLNNTKVNENFSPTIGQMIPVVFYSYNIEYNPYNDSDTQYEVTISGEFCPNPDIQYLSMDGSVTYLVDIDSGSCNVLSDPNNIHSTFLVFILN